MDVKKAKFVAINSTKGGVGKTFITLNLAGAFEKLGKKVLIVDLDLSYGAVAISLNIDQKHDSYNLVTDLNNNRYTVFDDYVAKYSNAIDVLCCPKDPRQGNKVSSRYIELMLLQATNLYDIVLIDMNHVLSEVSITVMDRVDISLFVMTNDPYDIKNMKSLIAIFKDSGKEDYKIILNDSISVRDRYYSTSDVKAIMKANIDYTISRRLYLKNIHNYVVGGKILYLESPIHLRKELKKFELIATDILNYKGGMRGE